MLTLRLRVISFQVTRHKWTRYINVTDGRTDGQLEMAIPRFTLRASRANKN